MENTDEKRYKRVVQDDPVIYNKVRQAVTRFFDQVMTIGELEKDLEIIVGPDLAEITAVTEVTRFASEREQAQAAELRKAGIQMVPVWHTNNDDLVCELCASKQDKPITDNKFPPAHLGCRCNVGYELPGLK